MIVQVNGVIPLMLMMTMMMTSVLITSINDN